MGYGDPCLQVPSPLCVVLVEHGFLVKDRSAASSMLKGLLEEPPREAVVHSGQPLPGVEGPLDVDYPLPNCPDLSGIQLETRGRLNNLRGPVKGEDLHVLHYVLAGLQGVNDGDDHLWEVCDFLARLSPARTYLAIPTRPPAEAWVRPPGEKAVNRAYQIFSQRVEQVEYLIGYEGNAFAFTGNVEEDLLSITAVHPMREEAVSEFLARADMDWSAVHRLITQNQLVEVEYEGSTFYMRALGGRRW